VSVFGVALQRSPVIEAVVKRLRERRLLLDPCRGRDHPGVQRGEQRHGVLLTLRQAFGG